MLGCNNCPAFAKCDYIYRGSSCAALRYSYGLNEDPEIKTNADHIRAMSDEELANFIVFHTGYNDGSGVTYYNFLTGEDDIREKAEKETLDWLKQTFRGGE